MVVGPWWLGGAGVPPGESWFSGTSGLPPEATNDSQWWHEEGKGWPPEAVKLQHQVLINGNKHHSITDAMFKDWVADTKDGTNFLEKGDMQAVDDAFTNGAVLVMSFWDDHYANMLWLDSQFPIDTDPIKNIGSYRGPCSVTSGNAQDLEKNVPNSTVRFSDIRWGPLGSTVARSDDMTV